MTFAPPTLLALAAYWTSNGGVNLGIIGNQKHCAGYHLGRDRIFGNCACRPDGTCEPGLGANDYSVQSSRDKATDAASAIDLGKLNGSFQELYAFSRWLVKQCQAKAPGAKDVREIIYSPDGVKVQRYSGIDGQIHTGPGNGDGSHTTHTHISYFRDSEDRTKLVLFAPYFIHVPDTGEDMPGRPFDFEEVSGTFTVRGAGHDFINPGDDRPETRVHDVPDGLPKTVGGRTHFDAPIDDHAGDRQTGYLVRHTGPDGKARAYIALAADGDFVEKPAEPKVPVELSIAGKTVYETEV